MADNPSFIEVQKYLAGVDYPATKDQLMEAARGNKASDEVLDLLDGLPDREFEGPTGVSEAVAR
jgi:hypothetical protein